VFCIKNKLIIGYGNNDRQDDGVAWHVIKELLDTIGYQITDLELSDLQDYRTVDKDLDVVFTLQLMPEMADFISNYCKVCFIDAHTGNQNEEIHYEAISPLFQQSPFTHHLTPQSLLSIAKSLYHKQPDAVLLSIRGYEFGFFRTLSPQTQILVKETLPILLNWISDNI